MKNIELCHREYYDSYSNVYENMLLEDFGEAKNIIRPVKLCCISGISKKDFLSNEEKKILEQDDYDFYVLLGGNQRTGLKLIYEYLDIEKTIGICGKNDTKNIYEFYDILTGGYDITEISDPFAMDEKGSFQIGIIDGEPPFISQEECFYKADSMESSEILLCTTCPYHIDYRPDILAREGLKGITYYLYKNHVPYIIYYQQKVNTMYVLKNGTVCLNLYGINSIFLY